MSTIDNLNSIYTSKISIKTVLGTESDDFENYGTYVTNNITASYNNGYASGYATGYDIGYADGQAAGGHDYSQDYLTFEIITDGTIIWKANSSNATKTISYSKNDGAWTQITSSTSGVNINVNAGDIVRFRGSNDRYCNDDTISYSSFVDGTATFNIYGNIMSMVYGDTFAANSALTNTNVFLRFFNKSKCVSAENLVLPATTLTDRCYQYMFNTCTSLTTAPEIPATTLTANCYNGMFYGCSSLTATPALPATILAANCYDSMFYDCTSLTTAPAILPATTLADRCYQFMFKGCALTTAPELPATTLTSSCYYYMFRGCTSLTTAPELPATTLADSCYRDMFLGCTSLTTAPAILPATTLVNACYYEMFENCTSLTTAPELPATTLITYCYYRMFASCRNLNYIKAMFITYPSQPMTGDWVNGVSSSGTFVKNSAAEWTTVGNYAVPNNWTVQTAAA